MLSGPKQVELNVGDLLRKPLKSSGGYLADQSTYYLHGIGVENCNKLADAGVHSIGELACHGDLVKISETSGISFDLLKTLQKKASSILREEIYQIGDFSFPGKVIYFDLETEPGGGRIWLIGCLINDMPFQFYADTWLEEYGIIRNFLDLVSYYDDYPLVSYSGTNFDLRFLEEALLSYGEKVDLWHRHIDLCTLLKRCFIFPTKGYSLKSVGKVLGYEFVNAELNGLKVSNLYEKHIETGNSLSHNVYTYNMEDVRVLQFIVRTLKGFNVRR